MRVEMNLDVQRCHEDDDIDSRIAEFKQDSDKMHDLNLFIDSVLAEAQKNAEVKLQEKLEQDRPKNAELYGLRKSVFPPDPDKELKCYTLCIAQMAGTMTKKGELSFSKTMAQIEAMVPPDLKPMAKEALTHCKDTRNKLLTGIKQHRVVTRTRGIVLRIFEAICNCTNSATIPGQRPATAPANLASSSRN